MGAAYNPTSTKTKAEGIAFVKYALLFKYGILNLVFTS